MAAREQSWWDSFRIRFKARNYGRVVSNRLISELVAILSLIRYTLPVEPRSKRLAALLTACKRTYRPGLQRYLKKELAPLLEAPACQVWTEHSIGLARYDSSFGDINKKGLTTSLLLKAPGPNGEKGVLYSSFEYNWLRLIKHHDAKAFFDRYYLVGASSGLTPDYVAFAHLAGSSKDPIFIGISNTRHMQSFDVAAPVIQAVPLMACDWIDPADYVVKPRNERTIDIVMVANWLRLKRHWLLFEALRTMRPDLRIVLIGRNGDGRTNEDLRAEARAFGVRQSIEILNEISVEEVRRHQSDSRISLLFSNREGSCVAPVESMFADTPVAMMADGEVGSKAYINKDTGILVERAGLGRTLSEFLERRETYRPREWALANVTCHHSSQKLNAVLREYAQRAGHAWTTDIAPLCWRYVPRHVNAADDVRLAPGVEELRSTLGIELVKWEYKPKAKPPVLSAAAQ
jgi:glycosyltransferase involved in cell wall biosynthesis